MLDIKYIRENPDKVKDTCKKRFLDCDIDKVLKLDKKKRKLLQDIEELRAKQNKLGKDDIKEGKKVKEQIKKIEPDLEKIEQEVEEKMRQIPNIPLDSVPVGEDDSKNEILRTWGEKTKFDFKPKDHLELGEALDIIDVKRAAKVSGSRFGYLKGDAVLLEFALVELAMKTAIQEGFTPIVPPVFVKEETMENMGYIDTEEDKAERYLFPGRLPGRGTGEKNNLYLVGTAEQAVGPMHADEVLQGKELPKRYVAFSTCFREEAGSYGRDTRGILRVHQFDKVEFFSFCDPEKSEEEHEFLVQLEEKLWQALEIPYQVMQLCTGDMSRPSASTIDIEAWLPGQNMYREVSSASNTTDFQSRRLNTRFRSKDNKLEYVHMLNATGFAIGRTLIAIMENYQQKDGTIKIPKVLQQYIGKSSISVPKTKF
ncbi:serine--tRNA ligase [Patescibacteria group bacterium]|nr:serine--tRNA ligase [Patescibacteria group bacterium]